MKKTVTFIAFLLMQHVVIFTGNRPSMPLAEKASTITIQRDKETGDTHFHNHFHPRVDFNNSNNNSNTNTNAAYAFAQSCAQATSKLYAKFRTRIDPHMQQIQKLSAADCAAWIKLNKKEILFGSIATIYCGISARLIRGNHYVNRSDLWASWKPHMTAKEMQACPQHDLQKSLIEEVLKRYLSKSPNRLACYLLFLKDAEEEEKRFAQHLMLARFIRKSMLMRFFPINDQKIKRAHSKQKRLAFIKHIFISWAALQKRLKSRAID